MLASSALPALGLLVSPVWMFDITAGRMVWANAGALRLWEAETLDELRSRDFAATMSEATRTRLAVLDQAFARGESVVECWTFYPKGVASTVECACSGVRLDGRPVMLVEGRVLGASSEAERRAVEALRHIPDPVTLYTADGRVLLRNPAAHRVLDPLAPELDDRFAAVFADPADAATARGAARDGAAVALTLRVRADGERWHEMVLRSIPDPVTGAAALLVHQHDVSERIDTLRALTISEERLAYALDGSNDGLWDWNVATGDVYFSPRWRTMLGYPADRMEPRIEAWERMVHRDDLGKARRALADHFDGLTDVYECEHRVRAADGRWLWILDRGRVVARDARGRPLRMVGTHTDITRRKTAEAELDRSTRWLDTILDRAPVGIVIVDPQRRILRANRALATLLKRDPAALAGESARILFRDDADYQALGACYAGLREGRTQEQEAMLCRADGVEVWCRLFGQRIGTDDAEGFVWVIEDITHRRAAEQELRATAAFQRILIDTVPMPISVKDRQGRFIDVNTEFEHWIGLKRTDILGRTVADVAPPLLHAVQERADRELLERGGRQVYECRVPHHDGSERHVMFSRALFQPEDGGSTGIVAAILDITERKNNEQALRERQALFETMFTASHAVKMLVEPADGRIVDVNPAAARFYGYSLERLRTMRVFDINCLPEAEVRACMEQARREQRQYFTFRHRLASGEIRDVEIYGSPIEVNGRSLLIALIHDITDRNRAETALQIRTRELERSNAELEAFAYVASHDLRQPLRTINSYLSLLQQRLAAHLDDDAREFIGFARDGALRMDRLIVDLLEYSRVGRKSKPFAPVDLAAVIDGARHALATAIAEAAASVDVAPALPVVDGDPGELLRLFQNLLGNAVKYRRADRTPQVRITARSVPEGWHIMVADNGIGISPDQLERVFGIFQRLHPRGRYEGTGIGLAICRKVVEHHRGRIWATSDGEAGSVFHVVLPGKDARHDQDG